MSLSEDQADDELDQQPHAWDASTGDTADIPVPFMGELLAGEEPSSWVRGPMVGHCRLIRAGVCDPGRARAGRAHPKELMARRGQDSERAALIYLHSSAGRQRALADEVGRMAAAALAKSKTAKPSGTLTGTQAK